jgi:hypothetical protein
LIEKPEAVQSVLDALNELPFMKKYQNPSTSSSAYININKFVNSPNWEDTLKLLVSGYKESKWLQDGGTGCMTSITWLFGKCWSDNVEKIANGQYAPKRERGKEEYKAKNEYLFDGVQDGQELEGFKMA